MLSDCCRIPRKSGKKSLACLEAVTRAGAVVVSEETASRSCMQPTASSILVGFRQRGRAANHFRIRRVVVPSVEVSSRTEAGGIRRLKRVRSRLALSLLERQEVSRGVVAGRSMRSIAAWLGRRRFRQSKRPVEIAVAPDAAKLSLAFVSSGSRPGENPHRRAPAQRQFGDQKRGRDMTDGDFRNGDPYCGTAST